MRHPPTRDDLRPPDPRLRSIPIRLDYRTSAPFVAANRLPAQWLPKATHQLTPGGHEVDYWSSHVPAAMRWVAPDDP